MTRPLVTAAFIFSLIVSSPAWCGGSVTGTVSYEGEVPVAKQQPVLINADVCGPIGESENLVLGKRGTLKNAVVFIQGPVAGSRKLEALEGGFKVDQHHCRFEPHVVVVPVGVPLKIFNSDPILHNFHTTSRTNPSLILGQIKSAPPMEAKFDHPEIIHVTCDIHPWMSLWVVVAENPYYVVTGDDGNFQLRDIPAGDYNLAVWHETFGSKTQRISVKEGEDLHFDVKFGQRK